MKVKNTSIETYVAEDGREFYGDKEACEFYEEVLMQYRYYSVLYHPDLTEGRGYYKSFYIGTKLSEDMVEFVLSELIGNKISFIMGAYRESCCMHTWKYNRVDSKKIAKSNSNVLYILDYLGVNRDVYDKMKSTLMVDDSAFLCTEQLKSEEYKSMARAYVTAISKSLKIGGY